jgi:Apea-like HEPN
MREEAYRNGTLFDRLSTCIGKALIMISEAAQERSDRIEQEHDPIKRMFMMGEEPLFPSSEEIAKDLQASKEYRKYEAEIKKDKDIAPQLGRYYNTSRISEIITPWRFISYIIDRIRFDIRFGNTSEVQNHLKQLYSDMEKFFYSNEIEVIDICHLSGFRPYSSEIRLDAGLVIKQVPIPEEVYNESPSTIPGVRQEFGVEWHTKESRRIDRDPIDPDFQKTKSIFQKLITSLRLFKPGDIGLDHCYSKIKLNIPIDPKQWILDYPAYSDRMRNYSLSKHERVRYLRLWQGIKDLNFGRELETAINRFHYSYEKKNNQDKLTDNVVSLEALFSGGRTDSVTYKLSLRYARMVKSKIKDRKDAYRNMTSLYDKRSKILHGGSISLTDIELIQNSTRDAIKRYIAKLPKYNFDHNRLIEEELDYS